MSAWTKIRDKIVAKLLKWLGLDGSGEQDSGHGQQDGADEVPFKDLDFCWGGFKGGSAIDTGAAQIKNLKISGSSLRYSWKSGGCENIGASSKEDASCLACLFCRIGGKWRGGKFDWLSTSRITRDFKNIFSGYNGWDREAISKADAYAFVIVSRDGRKRTNVIRSGKSSARIVQQRRVRKPRQKASPRNPRPC